MSEAGTINHGTQTDSIRSESYPYLATIERIQDAEVIDYAVKDQGACRQT